MTFVLLHSPFVGPFTWEPVARELSRVGETAVVPSLLGVIEGKGPYVRTMADRLASELAEAGTGGPLTLIAHSAAGFFLPALRGALDLTVGGYMFVDARLPRDGASLFEDSPAPYVEQLRQLSRAGWLPRWSEWFPEGAIEQVLPDRSTRERFEDELVPIPLALFEEPAKIPKGWPDAPCGYIRLSRFYETETAAARSRGWAVREVEAAHFHMLLDPPSVTRLLLDLYREMAGLADTAG